MIVEYDEDSIPYAITISPINATSAVTSAVSVEPYAVTIPATAPHRIPVMDGIDTRSENSSCVISRRLMMSVAHALKKLSKNVGPDKNRHKKTCRRYLCDTLRGSTMYFNRRSPNVRLRDPTNSWALTSAASMRAGIFFSAGRRRFTDSCS